MKNRSKIIVFLLVMHMIICVSLTSCFNGVQKSTKEFDSVKPRDVNFYKGDISVLIPAAARGGNDLIVRALIPGLKGALGVNIVPVNQSAGKGGVAFTEVAGEIDLVTCGPEGKSFVDSGKVRPLAVIYPTRYPSFPDVPTIKEAAGLDIEYKVWRGYFTTAGTDEATIKILSDACKKAVESEEFKKYASVGMLASYKDYKEFAQIVEKEGKELEVLMPEVLAQIEAENKAGGKQ